MGRRQKEILESLIAGYRREEWKAELLTLDERKAELTAMLAEPSLPALHPKMADIFREKATTLPPAWSMTSSATRRASCFADSSTRSSFRRAMGCYR